jgi:alpha,alpha-trehalase
VVGDLGELKQLPPETADPPDALDHFHDIAARLPGRRPAIFLDYDGTLTPIVARPELAVLDRGMRQTVSELAELYPVAMISGRDRADVERLVGLPGIVYAGSHGFDITGPGGLSRQYEGASRFLPELDKAEQELKRRLDGVEGVIVERKLFAIAVHYRLVAEDDVSKVERAVDDILNVSSGLRKTYGKKVFELRPAVEWDKGKAVLWLIDELGLDRPDILPVYIGDDVTDEDAFAAIAERGIGILVAEEPQRTAARFRVRSTEEVGVFLRKLIATLRRKAGP